MQTTHCTTLIPQLFHVSTTEEEKLSLHGNFALSARLYVIRYTVLCAAFFKDSILVTDPLSERCGHNVGRRISNYINFITHDSISLPESSILTDWYFKHIIPGAHKVKNTDDDEKNLWSRLILQK